MPKLNLSPPHHTQLVPLTKANLPHLWRNAQTGSLVQDDVKRTDESKVRRLLRWTNFTEASVDPRCDNMTLKA
ncbi:hypothetical protein PAMP_000073 [Pampus punctatissimus]